MKNLKKSKVLTIRTTSEVMQLLQAFAKQKEWTTSYTAERIIKEYLTTSKFSNYNSSQEG